MQRTLSEFDLYLIAEGTYHRACEKLGVHLTQSAGCRGVQFAVWAPNAKAVSVIGDFNNWNPETAVMRPSSADVWECFVPDIGQGDVYKYHVESSYGDYSVDKADPYGFASEIRPHTASRVWSLETYSWHDGSWMASRAKRNSLESPISIYEVHPGSWRRVPEGWNRWLTHREMAPLLADYVRDAGFTHIELLPIMEHPFDGSWGDQTTGYFAPTSRLGPPADFMYLVDYLHQNQIGVILDWVSAHFPGDEAGLGYFDGCYLYEHADPKLGQQPEWNPFVLNYGRNGVHNFLISNALFWLDKYHADGLGVDAVASIVYLDYGGREAQWIANRYGGKENIDTIHFLRAMNEWNHCLSLDWHLLNEPLTEELKRWVRDLNTLYRGEPLLYETDFDPASFEWVDRKDFQRSIISFLRRSRNREDQLLFVCNFTPVLRHNYRVGAPSEGFWKEILISDAPLYGGSGQGNFGGLSTVPLPSHGQPFSLNMTLSPSRNCRFPAGISRCRVKREEKRRG